MNIIILVLCLFLSIDCLANDKLKQIENSLNDIKTMQAKILQIDSNHDNANGVFYLYKPGKMRIEYKSKKNNILMIASKQMITYYDKDLDEISHIPTSSTPATLLMVDKIDFNNFEILSFEENNNIYAVTFYQKDKKDDGVFTFTFKKEDNFILQRIDKYDDENKNNHLSILFTDVRINKEINDKIFIFKDRRIFS